MKTRLFAVNQIHLLGCYSDPDLRIYIYKKNFDLICHKKILSILDFWITKDLYYVQQEQDGSLKLKILAAFQKETAIKLTAKDLKTFKVSGDWVYIVSSDGLCIYSRRGDHVATLNINHSLQQVSLAFDAFERLVGFSTEEALVVKRTGLHGVVNYVLNEIYESAVANDIISKEQGWVVIKDVKNMENFAHWRAHTTEVLKISFSPSGLKVFTSTLGSNSFHVWDLVNMTDQQPSLVYVLSRGYTPATIYDISWTKNETWLSVSTSHGTSHLYFLNPFSRESNSKPKNQSPEIRIKRPLQQDRRDFLSYSTSFIHPFEIIDDSVLLSLVSALSNDIFTIDTFEITGSFDTSQKITLVRSNNLSIENGDTKTDLASLLALLNAESGKPNSANSWHSLVSIESYQTQPFWSLNNVKFFTFEEDLSSISYKENCLNLSQYRGVKPFNMIESIALPNGSTGTSARFPAVNWNGQTSESLLGAMDIELNKDDAIIVNPIVDQNKRNDINFDDEWTVKVEGVQMEDVI